MRILLTHNQEMKIIEAFTRENIQPLVDSMIAEAKQEGYNEGKAAGIKQAKRAFALALKQKGESNNDVLR